MSESFEKRLEAAEKEYAARNKKGPLLTYPGATYLHVVDDADAIEIARAEGRPVIMPGDPEQLTMTRDSAWNERPVVVYE